MPRDAAYLLDMLLAAREAIEFAATVEDFSAFRDSRMAHILQFGNQCNHSNVL